MIKWGIVGLGNMAGIFANAIKEVENSKLISVASKSSNKLNTFQKNFEIKKENKFTNYKDLINSKEIDAVYIATLNNTHVDLILDCAKNNKKILCEKPIGLDLDQAHLALLTITISGIFKKLFNGESLIIFFKKISLTYSFELSEQFYSIHILANYVLIGLIGLHILAVLFHKFLLGESIIKRIL